MYWLIIGDLSTKDEMIRIYQTLVDTPLKALVIIANTCLFGDSQLCPDISHHIFQLMLKALRTFHQHLVNGLPPLSIETVSVKPVACMLDVEKPNSLFM